jgi:phenylacetate-CoA ligase
MWQFICGRITYPAWNVWDGGGRLEEFDSLSSSQWWSAKDLQDLQVKRLRDTVGYAWAHCAFYRRHWGRPPDISVIEDIRQLPLLAKADVAASVDELISTEFERDALVSAKTGGSTGTALRVFFDDHCQKLRNAAAMRSDWWASWRPGMLTGALWGSPAIPRTPKERIRNCLHDRVIYLDTMRMDESSMAQFTRRVQELRIEILFGHAHSLYILARFVQDHGIRLPTIKGIIATSMMLLERERQCIEAVLGVPVSNRYGCEEVGLIASECTTQHRMHVNAEHVLLEVVRDDGSPAALGEEGQIVVTDLVNRGMPLIRYAIGDRGAIDGEACTCGRGLPILGKLAGRTADCLRRRDGSLVAGISLVEKTLTAIPGIEQLQIVQETTDCFVLNMVPASGFTREHERELVEAITAVFGRDASVEVRKMDRLPQEANSKYRFAICKLLNVAEVQSPH